MLETALRITISADPELLEALRAIIAGLTGAITPPVRKTDVWTAKRLALGRELYALGLPLVEILAQINQLPGDPILTPDAVKNQAHRKNWRRAKVTFWTPERLGLAQARWEAGATMAGVLEAVLALPGPPVSLRQVRGQIERAGWRRKMPVTRATLHASAERVAKLPAAVAPVPAEPVRAVERPAAVVEPLPPAPAPPAAPPTVEAQAKAAALEPIKVTALEVAEWAGPRCLRYEWPGDLDRINAKRREFQLRPFAVGNGR